MRFIILKEGTKLLR